MKSSLLIFALICSAAIAADFPTSPNSELTPGSLCQSTKLRYAERIPYCKRDVSREMKQKVFQIYRSKLGFRLDPAKRGEFKIDHLIPLCAGGSNNKNNLWPQHQTLYLKTDPLEHTGCEKLANGKIKQRDLVDLIKKAKSDPTQAPKFLKDLKRL